MPTTIPNSFEQYRELHESQVGAWRVEEDRERCTGCCDRADRLTRDGYCDTCLRYMFGYDQAEEKVARAMLGAAIRAARDAGVSESILSEAAREAITEQYSPEELAR